MAERLGQAFITIRATTDNLPSDLNNAKTQVESSVKSMQDSADSLNFSKGAEYVGQYARDVKRYAEILNNEVGLFRSNFSKEFDAISDKTRDQTGIFDAWAQSVASDLFGTAASVADSVIKMKAAWDTLGTGLSEVMHPINTVTQGLDKLTTQTLLAGRNAALSLGDSFMNTAANMGELNRQTGINLSDLQNYISAGAAAGVSSETMTRAITNTASAMDLGNSKYSDARSALEAMGISLTDSSGKARTWQSVILDVSNKFSTYEDGQKKAALATAIFGTENQKLIDLINQGGSALNSYLGIADSTNSKITQSEANRAQSMKNMLQIEATEHELLAKKSGEAWFNFGTQLNEILNSNKTDWEKWKDGISSLIDALVASTNEKANLIKNSLLNMVPNELKSLFSKNAAPEEVKLSASGQRDMSGVKVALPKITPPVSIPIGEFDKTLTDIRNKPENVLNWKAEQTADFWLKNYNWEVDYNGKETELSKQLWARYADAARAANASATASTIKSFADIDQFIRKIEDKTSDVTKNMHAIWDEWSMDVHKSGGFALEADRQGVDIWAGQKTQAVWKEIADAQGRLTELQQLVAKNGGDAAAVKGLAQAQEFLNTAWANGLIAIENIIPDYAKFKKAQLDLKNTTELAQVNVSYSELTGTMKEQLNAQKALIEANAAEKLGSDWKTKDLNELGKAYKKIYEEQIRLADLRANGSMFDGMREGIRDIQRSLPTAFDTGREAINYLKDSIDSAADSLAEFTLTSKRDFSDFASSVIKDILRMIYKAQLMKLAFGESGSGGIMGLLGMLPGIGSLFGGGSASAATSIATPNYDSFMETTTRSIFGYASGGNPPLNSDVIVGENGPEIVRFKRPGTVIPNNRIGASGRTSVTVSPNVQIQISNTTGQRVAAEPTMTTDEQGNMVVRLLVHSASRNQDNLTQLQRLIGGR